MLASTSHGCNAPRVRMEMDAEAWDLDVIITKKLAGNRIGLGTFSHWSINTG